MCLGVFLLEFVLCETLCFLALGGCFLFHVRKVLDGYLFKFFSATFCFSSSAIPVIWMLVRLMLYLRSLRLSSFLFLLFVFILLLGSYFHHCIFQFTYLFFCLSYSAIDSYISFQLLCFLWLFFSSSKSLLNISCIFWIHISVLFVRFWIIFTIISLWVFFR